MKKILHYILPTLLLVALFSCEENSIPDGRFIGTWISNDKLDTLIFVNEDSFSKPFYDGIYHPFEYSYRENSITIQYKGPDKILVQPTTHDYNLKNKELTIDFSDGCYGFESEKITYLKQ